MTVIDHRWRQNVVRTKSSTRGAAVCHWCSYHILTSYWRDARQHGIYLLIKYCRTVLHIITGTHYRTWREQTHLDQISERRTETNKVLMLIKLIVTIWSYCIWRRLFFWKHWFLRIHSQNQLLGWALPCRRLDRFSSFKFAIDKSYLTSLKLSHGLHAFAAIHWHWSLCNMTLKCVRLALCREKNLQIGVAASHSL